MMNWIDISLKDDKDYYLKIPILEKSDLDSLKEAHRTIDQIVNHYPSPYVLYLSGGVDSQAMLWAWYTSGKDFEAVSYVYNETMNLHDLDSGMPKFLKQTNVSIERRNIDLLSFYNTEYKIYRKKYRCGSPHICAYMYMADQQKQGTVIFSGCGADDGAVIKNKFYTKNEWKLYHYGLKSQRSIVPFFLSETQPLHFSFNPSKVKQKTKAEIYNEAGYPVVAQNEVPNKYNSSRFSGFEQIKDYYDISCSHLVTPKHKLSSPPDQDSRRVYDLILRNSYELLYYSDKYNIKFVK